VRNDILPDPHQGDGLKRRSGRRAAARARWGGKTWGRGRGASFRPARTLAVGLAAAGLGVMGVGGVAQAQTAGRPAARVVAAAGETGWATIRACATARPSPTVGLPATRVRLDPLMVGAPLRYGERVALCRLAASTWAFFGHDVNPTTDLPMDNIGFDGAPATGPYTSPTDIAMYLWSIVAAENMHLISHGQAQEMARRELTAIRHLTRYDGFLLGWYDTSTGQPITGPGGTPITTLKGQFLSTVDNGWYASALVIVREAFPALFDPATQLLDAMKFHLFYDNGNQATNITAGQMYGGYTIGVGPAGFEYGNLNTDPRIAAYMGMGLGQLPGDVWWRTWRTLPASFTWQTQVPVGPTVTYRDPYTHRSYSVVEGHYSYDGITYVPSWGGSEFEGLMASLVMPETTWGVHSFGQNDVNYAEASIAYATKALHYPVWGLSPASTPGTSGGYTAYGAYALGSGGTGNAYANTAVTPYASFLALPVVPQQAFANIEKLIHLYPQIVGPYGLFDSVDPTTGVVAPRYLVLDQGMIMAGLDDALVGGGLQRYMAADPVAEHDRPYLEMEHFSITPVRGTHRVAEP